MLPRSHTHREDSSCQITCCVPSGDGDTTGLLRALGHGPCVKPANRSFRVGSPPRDISNQLAGPQPHDSPHNPFSLRPAVSVLRQSRGAPNIWVSSRTRGGRAHAVGKGTEGEASTRGSASGPRGHGQGPARRGAHQAWVQGGPGLSPGLGLADGGAVGVGNVREPTTSALRVRAPEAGGGPPSAELSEVPAG